jgi:hydroxymethylglutaryl-CoA lyase
LQIADSVTITEVGPRDGLQALDRSVPTEDKIAMIELLVEAGIRSIEATSFVHPRVVPQMADAERVMSSIERRSGVTYRALVPNRRGAERAIAARTDVLVALITVSETYSHKNQNRGVQDLVRNVDEILQAGRHSGTRVDIAVGTAFFCPYEGPIAEERVESIFSQLVDLGGERFYVATTSGMADPAHVQRLCARLLSRWPQIELGIHLHNTNGMALANALAAMDAGVRTFEGSICGLGGGIVMPHGMAAGNVPTEDLVQMFSEMGVATEIDLSSIGAAARKIADLIGIDPKSYVARGGTKAETLLKGQATLQHHPA